MRTPFDLILLSCKAYDLDDAIASFNARGRRGHGDPPLLENGMGVTPMRWRSGLRAAEAGQCAIPPPGCGRTGAVSLNDAHFLSFGERDGTMSARVEVIFATLRGGEVRCACQQRDPVQEMWEKWVLDLHCRRDQLFDAGANRWAAA